VEEKKRRLFNAQGEAREVGPDPERATHKERVRAAVAFRTGELNSHRVSTTRGRKSVQVLLRHQETTSPRNASLNSLRGCRRTDL